MKNRHEPASRLAEPSQVGAIKGQWARVFGEDDFIAKGHLASYTHRSDPRLLTWAEANLYLDLLKTRADFKPQTDAEHRARLKRA